MSIDLAHRAQGMCRGTYACEGSSDIHVRARVHMCAHTHVRKPHMQVSIHTMPHKEMKCVCTCACTRTRTLSHACATYTHTTHARARARAHYTHTHTHTHHPSHRSRNGKVQMKPNSFHATTIVRSFTTPSNKNQDDQVKKKVGKNFALD